MKSKPKLVAAVEAELIKAVRNRSGISRVELARHLDIAPSTAGIYVERLVRERYLLESDKASKRLGRPATRLNLNPAGGRFIGLDFEARSVMSTAVDFSANQLGEYHTGIQPHDSVEDVLGTIEHAIEQMLENGTGPVLGIGVAVPGLVDPARGLAIRYPFIEGWSNIELRARLEARFNTPVFLENNVRCMALAELWFGHGKNLRDFICLGVRSGIGAGIVVDGRLLRGWQNQAGELGKWSLPTETRTGASPGVNGTRFEDVASISALLSGLSETATVPGRSSEMLLQDFIASVRSGDSAAVSHLREAARHHSWAIWQLVSVFNPARIIFTWPLAELGEIFLDEVRQGVGSLAASHFNCEITGSQLGRYNGALGAAALALHEWRPKR